MLLTITNISEPPLSSETDNSDNDYKIFDKGLDPTNATDLNNNNASYPRDRPKEPIKSLVGNDVSTLDLVNLDLSKDQVGLFSKIIFLKLTSLLQMDFQSILSYHLENLEFSLFTFFFLNFWHAPVFTFTPLERKKETADYFSLQNPMHLNFGMLIFFLHLITF